MSVNPIDLLIRATDAIYKFEASFQLLKEEEHSVYTLEVQGSELKHLWAKVKTVYDNCLTHLETNEDATNEDFESADGKYEATYRAYVRCLALIREKSHLLPKVEKTSSFSVPASPSHGNETGVAGDDALALNASNQGLNTTLVLDTSDNRSFNLALPPLDIDVFRGDCLSWPTFRDMFTTFVIQNKAPTNLERLCFLIRKTSGEARDIVSRFPITHSGFEPAWAALVEAYDNPRILVNHQLKLLFGLQSLETETSLGLKNLQRGIVVCLSAMATYKIPTENWDPIIVFLVIQRLPKSTVALWEQSVKEKSALSLWKDLNEFLSDRIRTLDCLRDLKGSEKKEQKVKAHYTAVPLDSSKDTPCVLCFKKGHPLYTCNRYRRLSVSERLAAVRRHRLCINCLLGSHGYINCPNKTRCGKCKLPHHTSLHRQPVDSGNHQPREGPMTSTGSPGQSGSSGTVVAAPRAPSNVNTEIFATNRQAFHVSEGSTVLLGTAMVTLLHQGLSYPARALIDPASEGSLITERLRKELRLPIKPANVVISGVNQAASTSHKICTVTIKSSDSQDLSTNALVLPNISGNLPSSAVDKNILAGLSGLKLADPNFFDCRPVDLLIGGDLYPYLILDDTKRRVLGSLVAQNTIFGYILTGPVPSAHIQVHTTTILSEEDSVNETLQKFWLLEDTPKRKYLSPEDKYCEENYKKTTRRASDGRYVVTLPLKPEFPLKIALGESRTNVVRQFIRNESSLLRRPLVKEVYDQVVKEYLTLGHMKPVLSEVPPTICYLPHHPVINPEKQTSKLRVVFNASNKTTNGNSLNDILYVGPTLQADLVVLILRWRLFRFVFNCDITQMYRQIRVDPSHTPLQRIVFREDRNDFIRDFELQTVTFGVNCAPYLAIRTLLQLAEDSENQFPLAANILRRCMYVDDVLTGGHDIDTVLNARDQLIDTLSSAKFELRKWTANDRDILQGLPQEHLIDAKLLTFVESSSSKPLGIRWNAQLDAFFFCVSAINRKPNNTKREVLSLIAKLFDPVGWLGPVIVVAKIIMQKIWLDNIAWDENLPRNTENEWQKFIDTYSDVNNIKIPRWVKYAPEGSSELHLFSDASEKAFAGVIYIRTKYPNGDIHTHLLTSKTKVAPIKSISLPRLELCGAVLASELLKTVVAEIDIPLNRVYCWSDSTIVLAWVKKTPSTWTTFVANRVCRIQENVGGHNWNHVKSEDNPADLGSRGVSPNELASSQLWWHGPRWLQLDRSQWPKGDLTILDTNVEMRSVQVHASVVASNYKDILENFSSLDKACRVIAYIVRFFHRTHPKHKISFLHLTKEVDSSEINHVKVRLAILAQKTHFASEHQCLLNRKPLSPKSSLLCLNPFIDKEGVMRLNGRLAKSPTLSYTEQHPIILPYECEFTKLLVNFVHLISIHGGNQLMLRILRIEYWIPRLKTKIRAAINRCKRCVISKKRACRQIMSALPPERTVIQRPFTTTGVDFAGPFEIKSFTGRACRVTKGYVCVFVCFTTKAIHLEAASDLSTPTFLDAFHRFIARRGCPQTIFSDNGTNFVGASRELERDFKAFLNQCNKSVNSVFSNRGVSWRFIPAGAPHMGGLWEGGVKSFKTHFRKHAHGLKFTFEELSTVLSRIEACLNSRPISALSDNPQEIAALTPGHFLIGAPLLAPPEPFINESPLSLINRYRKMKALSHQFCLRWKDEYLLNLHKRYKWKSPERDIAEDDLVVIRHEQLPPSEWRLGRVVKTYPGKDSHVRVVDVRTASGIVKRPIAKLVVLNN